MPTYSAVPEGAIRKVCEAIFAFPEPEIVEAYSSIGEKLRRFTTMDELLSYCEEARSGVRGPLIHLGLRYPDMLGEVQERRIDLKGPGFPAGSFRHALSGWGLVWIQLLARGTSTVASTISANSQKRALKWFPTSPELGSPEAWFWPSVSRHTARLSRALRAFV
jgi:hypothetical protein